MLEIIHLSKIYKSKKAEDVKALDDVSIRFPERGMVFLLGKSGSGKSTLLNVCGGLDVPTSGEIIVKGKSSASFTQSDFDSYRNTFIGFVFQEYNILNEFTVEDNIALAPELQGKPKDKERIAALLKEVDLAGYAKRKPNTLSGGQKQRIAIARALIKNPEIIMADEPTGALDSNTGRQVLETLKKLSQTKLVIVVSHDREFAERYGDRIIELQDGKVISDTSKATDRPNTEGNVCITGESLFIKSAEKLTESEIAEVGAFLKRAKGQVVLAGGEKDVSLTKKAIRLTDEGREIFNATDEKSIPKKEYKKEDCKFIRSHLPLLKSAKIGVSGMKSKPVRLVFTIFLSTVAFVMFGLLSTMMLYSKDSTLRQSYMNSGYTSMFLQKYYVTNSYTYDERGELEYTIQNKYDTFISEVDYTDMLGRYGDDVLPLIRYQQTIDNVADSSFNNGEAYYYPNISYVTYAAENASYRHTLSGNYPVSENEVAISSYIAEGLVQYNLLNSNGNVVELSQVSDVIGKTICMTDGKKYVVTGIFDCSIPARYESIRDESVPLHERRILSRELETEIKTTFPGIMMLSESAFRSVRESNALTPTPVYQYETVFDTARTIRFTLPQKENLSIQTNLGYYQAIPADPDFPVTYFNPVQTELREGQIVLDISLVQQAANSLYYEILHDEGFDGPRQDFIDSMDRIFIDGNYYYFSDVVLALQTGSFSDYDWETDQQIYSPIDEALLQKMRDAVADLFYRYRNDIDFTVTVQTGTESRDYTMVGFIAKGEPVGNASQDSLPLISYFSAQDAAHYDSFPNLQVKPANQTVTQTAYRTPQNAWYHAVILPFDCSAAQSKEIISMESLTKDDTFLLAKNEIRLTIDSIDDITKELSPIFLWVGIIFAVFSALLLSNFISVSISYKKKDIGILRAIGARGTDVFRIFFCESGVLSLICIALSSIASIVCCILINNSLPAAFAGVNIFVFGPLNILLIFMVALITSVVATFLPVYVAAKKKPVDSIRAL